MIMKTAARVLLSLIGLFVFLFYAVYPFLDWWQAQQPPHGSSPQDSYIAIQGQKPADAVISAYATAYGGGEDCGSFFWSASDGKKRDGAKSVRHYTHNFANSDTHYELRLPYQNFTSSGCDMKLYFINLRADNAYDPNGFARLKVAPWDPKYNQETDIDSVIEARDCQTDYSENLKRWYSDLSCNFYTNGKIRDKRNDMGLSNSAYSIYVDFTKFNDNTVIRYNILAGENYRSEPLNTEPKEQLQ